MKTKSMKLNTNRKCNITHQAKDIRPVFGFSYVSFSSSFTPKNVIKEFVKGKLILKVFLHLFLTKHNALVVVRRFLTYAIIFLCNFWTCKCSKMKITMLAIKEFYKDEEKNSQRKSIAGFISN